MSSSVTFSVLSQLDHPFPASAWGPDVGLISIGDTPLVRS
jgi:hypothetical protein